MPVSPACSSKGVPTIYNYYAEKSGYRKVEHKLAYLEFRLRAYVPVYTSSCPWGELYSTIKTGRSFRNKPTFLVFL